MTITTVDMANKAKEILGGEPSQVNVKNKPPVLLPRTPILLSSNTVIWDHFPNEANPLRNRMYMFSGLRELKWLQEVTKFPNPEYWKGIFAKIRTFEKEMNMTIDEIRETDLEPCLDELLNDAFTLADTITKRSSDAGSEEFQCGQRLPESDNDSSGTMAPLTMDDIRDMSDMDIGSRSPLTPPTQHAPQPIDSDIADSPTETTFVLNICANTSTKRQNKKGPDSALPTGTDTSDGLCVASASKVNTGSISNVKNESITINSDSDNSPPKTVKKCRINQYFQNKKK
ncbi:hypothetical protein DPMN_045504 [Dreissena polymorpha]|uniref:Parvovirus non-structural protein 1 helicase domain-containing protein n=1 Tax=Dreissena polymorpha TaxID=45954 RepID=A0A9D4D6N8_DREPO|nr:hypothetical protein DPMN_045504 [Dreissena polymorpha]